MKHERFHRDKPRHVWILLLLLLLHVGSSKAQDHPISIPVSQVDRSARVAGTLAFFQQDPEELNKVAPVFTLVLDLKKRLGDTLTYDQAVALQQKVITDLQAQRQTYLSVRDPWSNPMVSSTLDLLTQAAALIPRFGPLVPMAVTGFKLGNEALLKNEPFLNSIDLSLAEEQGTLARLKSPSFYQNYQDLFQRADDLAQSDPEFARIHETIISAFTQVRPSDTAEDVLRNVPQLADNPVLQILAAQPRTNGQITVTQEQLTSLFQNQMAGLYSSIETNRALLLQISATQSDIVSYLTNQAAITANRAAEEAARAETARQIQAANAAIYLLSTAIGFGDPKLAHEVSVVGNSTVQIADALDKLKYADLANTLISSANIAGAVMNVMSLFSTGEPTPDQVILQQIGALQQQISNLRLEMHDRFDRIDKSLNTIYDTMERGFAEINQNELQIRGALFDLQVDLHRLERKIFDFLDAGFRRDLNNAISGYLGYEERTGQPMDYADYTIAENFFYNWAINNSRDALSSGSTGRGYDDLSLFTELTSQPLESNLNYLNHFVSSRLNVNSFSLVTLANPRDWAISANAYVHLAHENPQHFRRISTNRLSDIVSIGQQLESSLAYLNFTNGLTSSGVNWSLWNAAFGYYRSKIPDFANGLVESETKYALQYPESNFVEVLAGSYSTDSQTPPRDGNSGQAYLRRFGSQGIYAMPDGSVMGIDLVTTAPSSWNYTLRRIDPLGTVSTLITIPGTPTVDGTNDARQILLRSFVVESDGTCYVAYSHYNVNEDITSITKVETNGSLTTFAGKRAQSGLQDGTKDQALFTSIGALYLDCNQNLYVADLNPTNRNQALLRVIDKNGIVTTKAQISDISFWLLGFVVDGQEGLCFASFNPLSIKRALQGSISTLPIPLHQTYLFPPNALAIGQENLLWVSDWAKTTPRPGTPLPYDVQDFLVSYPTSGTNPTAAIFWTRVATSYGNGSTLQVSGGALNSAWLGVFGDPSGYATMCVDRWNNLYVCAEGNYSPSSSQVYYGRFLARIGGRRNHQLGVFQRFASDLQTAGDLQKAAQKLDGAKELLTDLVTIGLSQSLDQDDLLRSLLLGSDGLVDTRTALSLIRNQTTALSNAPVYPLLNLPSVASARLDALERQIKLHLLEIDSHSHARTDSMVLHLTITNKTPLDDSAAAHTIGLLGAPAYQSVGLIGAQSLAGNNLGADITNGFTLGHPNDLTFGTNGDFTLAFWAVPDFVTVITGPFYYRPQPQGFLFIGNLASTNASDHGWWIRLDATGALACSFQRNVIMSVPSANGDSPSAWNSWLNYALVFARSAGVVRFYVNGVNVGQRILSNNSGDLGSGNIIMGGTVVTNFTLNGPLRVTAQQPLLNEFSLWRRALGSGEIKAMYNAGNAGTGVVAMSHGFQRSTSPREPLNIVHNTLDDLRLLQTFRGSPIPVPRLVQTFNPTNRLLQIVVYGMPGLNYVLESSTNLIVWQPYTAASKESVGTPVSIGQSRALFFRARNTE